MSFSDNITDLLRKSGIAVWRIEERSTESAELFFVRKQLDTRRIKDTHKWKVTVFRDSEAEGRKLRGSTFVEVLASDSDETVTQKLRDAFSAAQYAMNPYYDLPDAVAEAPKVKKGALAEENPSVSAGKMAASIFAPDTREDAFVNSAEVFVNRFAVRIITSVGTDVSYTDAEVRGEYVVQCKVPEDVEMFREFCYGECDTAALSAHVAESLRFAVDRARAQKVLKSGKYDVILTGEQTETLLSYYAERAHASMVYAGYSTWKQGDNVQNREGGVPEGEKLNLSMCATVPYSDEGIPMRDIPLLRDGVLQRIYGANRFCRYLGVVPTGNYGKYRCDNTGTASFAQMKSKPCLWAVSFSDFQMDSFSGHFGGELRLGYLIDGEKAIPVTGGSINGSLFEAQRGFVFSEERYETASYAGPYAVRLPQVSVAGSES